MAYPLYVALLWHMHQPLYRNTEESTYTLPWVRLHATKDYLHMARLLEEQPAVHATINVVPSLTEQLLDYANGRAIDKPLAISLKDNLSRDDKEFLLSFFFNINWDRVVNRYPRYAQLLHLRQYAAGDVDLLGEQYWRDLIAWFNLAWIDPELLRQDDALARLVAKGRGFTPADIATIWERSQTIIQAIIPTYRRLEADGQIELTTSPYYHCILPLIVDATSAHEASPGLPLPPTPFRHPEDAAEHLRRAVASHRATFGRDPKGLWPSEGAVSQETAEVIARTTPVRWIATDEAILARSLGVNIERDAEGHVTNPQVLYQPYLVETSTRPLTVIFRDRLLSDRIGFVYKGMDSRAAAEDLISRLHHISKNLKDDTRPYLVSIILDGENAWEDYPNNGNDFLRHVYALLAQDRSLRPVTVSEYLEAFPPRSALARLAAGSWIYGNLETWIGEGAQNKAWEFLARAREALGRSALAAGNGHLQEAWTELYIAEGSDWFWWYYSHNNPGEENLFDREFRRHLANVYRLCGLSIPEWLDHPIRVGQEAQIGRPPSGPIHPAVTAAPLAGDAWAGAGYVDPLTSSGAMQDSSRILRRLYFGSDGTSIYLRLETHQPVHSCTLAVLGTGGGPTAPTPPLRLSGWRLPSVGLLSWGLTIDETGVQAYRVGSNGEWQSQPTTLPVAWGEKVIELAIPVADLIPDRVTQLRLVVAIGTGNTAWEALPEDTMITLDIP
jgi:alpha-amylase/alpha-mannosidase (GH57 family)